MYLIFLEISSLLNSLNSSAKISYLTNDPTKQILEHSHEITLYKDLIL